MAVYRSGAATYDASAALAASTFCEAFQITANARGDAVALRLPDDSFALTWTEYAARVERLAEGLASLGVQRGGAVAGRSSFRFVACG